MQDIGRHSNFLRPAAGKKENLTIRIILIKYNMFKSLIYNILFLNDEMSILPFL